MNVPFADHVALVTHFLRRRAEIVGRIEASLLNVRNKPISQSRNRVVFDRALHGCFFGLTGLPREQVGLMGRLAARHVADGFEPVRLGPFAHELDPLELVVRAYQHWDLHRWPGSSGRLAYAQTIYMVFLLRHLMLLSLRVWDEGNEQASGCLADVQRLLDRLNEPPAAAAFVGDARWLVPIAQGPLTRHVEPYFLIAERIAASFTASEGLGLHAAGARLAGGHLRSQLRYRAWETGRPLDDPENLAVARNSNSMDAALLVRELVPLLEAYMRACGKTAEDGRDEEQRLELADAILQGLSADPELLLTRLDLLTPSTMLEELFVGRLVDGQVRLTALGRTHMDALERYRTLIGAAAEWLRMDAAALDPSAVPYSPLGITYGFIGDVLSDMALDSLVAQPALGLSVEDMFASRGRLEEKRARAAGWQALPRRAGEREHFTHSTAVAAETHARLAAALEARARHGAGANASGVRDARLFVVSEPVAADALADGIVPAGAVVADEHCYTSDIQRALAGRSTGSSTGEMLADRAEGRFLASVEVDGRWVGISKVILTLVTSRGQDAVVNDIPSAALDVLRLTCPNLIVAVADAPL